MNKTVKRIQIQAQVALAVAFAAPSTKVTL